MELSDVIHEELGMRQSLLCVLQQVHGALRRLVSTHHERIHVSKSLLSEHVVAILRVLTVLQFLVLEQLWLLFVLV